MKRILTGIKPTGRPHLGNYLASIKPSLELSEGSESFLFIADLHALTSDLDGDSLRSLCREVAATWLALGLDPEKISFFRQSDIVEISQLNWILACSTGKGLLDRAHAFKAAVSDGQDVNAGLYFYPVLMAADILAFGSTHVPVGSDQKQHVEMTREIAARFNKRYGDILTIPEPVIGSQTGLIPGLDGRKMSKSYNNTIPIFGEDKEIRKRVFSIITDSTPVEAPKDPEKSNIFSLYKLLADSEQTSSFSKLYTKGGMGWGDAKQVLLDLLLEKFREPKKRYQELLDNPQNLEIIFKKGADKARAIAGPLLKVVQKAVGIGAR